MKISEILKTHHKENNNLVVESKDTTLLLSLIHNLGDAFLIKHNFIYNKIRKMTISHGFSYSEKVSNLFLVLPFASLENIFETKTIFMLDNISALEKIEKMNPYSVEWIEVLTGYRKNYLFHESCHVVSRKILETAFFKSDKIDELLLKLIFEESFANACELMGQVQASTPLHRIFYEANSYSVAFHDNKKIQIICDHYDSKNIFKFLILAYIHSNFLNRSYSKFDLNQVINYIFISQQSQQQVQQLQSLAAIAFSLDDIFKNQTRKLHFKIHQINELDFQGLKSKYLSLILNDPATSNILDSMAKIFYT